MMEAARVGSSRRRRANRRGSIYIAVLFVAMIASICALAGMHLARVDLKNTVRSNDLQEAQLLANSGVEWAVSQMNHTPTDSNKWRTAYTSGVETTPTSIGNGTMSFKLVDDDGNLADDVIDPVWIYGYGRVGGAVWAERAKARNDRGQPLECLNTAIHCSRQLEVGWGETLTVSGAPASTDSNLLVNGTLVGDAQAVTQNGAGSVSGTRTVPAPRKGVPPPNLFNDYVNRATQISYTNSLQHAVLAPGVNECGGGVNAKGIYYLNTYNQDVFIQHIRLYGTLVINAGTGTVMINDVCFMQPASDDYPVLVIKGNTIFGLQSYASNEYLSESAHYHNFNPTGAPYLGVTDTDMADNYPSEIRGLIHIIGNVAFYNRGIYRGAILVQGRVTISGGEPQIFWDRNLIMNPPLGYSSNPTSTTMILQSQTWTRQASP